MKRWSGQFFPVLLLTLLAALSFWLERAVDLPDAKRDGKLRHDPDTFVDNFTVRRFSAEGILQYRLVSPHMTHFADDDSSLVIQPKLIYFRPGSPDVTLTGGLGYASSKGETVYFWEDVVTTRAATADRPELVARMPDLTVQPDEGIGFTGSPVEITQGQSWMKGVGLHMDNNTSILVLQSQVTGYHIRPKAPQ